MQMLAGAAATRRAGGSVQEVRQVSEIAELYGLDAFRSDQDIHTGKGYPANQKCKYGDEPATKRVVWADGRAYVPVCDKHLATAKRKLSDVVAVHDIPSPTH